MSFFVAVARTLFPRAGIQLKAVRPTSGPWIPAFARMTEKGHPQSPSGTETGRYGAETGRYGPAGANSVWYALPTRQWHTSHP